jgi:hypothetical protein
MKKAKRYVYLNLVFGIIWLLASFFKVGFNGQDNWFGYVWFVLAAFYIEVFIYQILKLKNKS